MKTGIFFSAFSIIALSAYLIVAKLEVFDHNISVSVSEDSYEYTFSARYDPANTMRVENYINSAISPNSLAGSPNDYFNVSTSLTDGTQFHAKESPGKLEIILDKRKNTTASYLRIKKMCEGVKQLIAGK